MFRRGAWYIAVLVLVVLVGSAVAQQLTGTQLYVTGNGPNAIGGETHPLVQLLLTGPFRPSGQAQAMQIASTLTPLAGYDGVGLLVNPSIQKGGPGEHNNFNGLQITSMAILPGSATVKNATSLKIDGAPTGATNNYAVWVASGKTRLGGTLQVAGDAQFDGNIGAKYQDVAEWVPSAHALAAATVAIIDSRAPNRVMTSDKPYDTHVAGVVSTRPGILLGEGGADKTKLAHSGRVKVKVDARYRAIAIGDLLVTSATPGHAMRSEPMNIGGAEIHRPGTIIGKALESLEQGQGEILVLLTLQ